MFSTIEDALETLVGLHDPLDIELESSDVTILNSIGRQVFRGKALTDRQCDLVTKKLDYYNISYSKELRSPLREIDRSKYIKLVDYPDNMIHESSDKGKFIKIKFPFNKRDIIDVQWAGDRCQKNEYYHKKGAHEHYFQLNESNVYNLVSKFIKRDFIIDETIIEYYNKIVNIIDNPDIFYPYVDKDGIYNTSDKTKEMALLELGSSKDNLILYKDRQEKYGLKNVYGYTTDNVLTSKLVDREYNTVLARPSDYSLDNIIDSLIELKRFPLLILIENLDQLKTIHTSFGNSYKHSVLFRMDNDEVGSKFNNYIKDNNLNVSIDSSPDILYTKHDKFKLPKPLLKNKWEPSAVLSFDAAYTGRANSLSSICDLIICHDENRSYFIRKMHTL